MQLESFGRRPKTPQYQKVDWWKGEDMYRLAAVVCVLVSVALLASTVLADESDLSEWAHTRWEAYVVEGPPALSAALHADGGTVFMGTPWDGLYYGDDSEQAWLQLQEKAKFHTLQVESERVLGEGNLVWGVLTMEGIRPDTDESLWLTLASALVFDEEGRIMAEDVIVLDGLPSDTPAPIWDGTVNDEAYAHHLREDTTGMDLWWRNGLAVLVVGVRAAGTGWVSVGFDPERMMQGADFVIGAVDDDGLTIEDHHGHAATAHRKDDHQDILAAGGNIDDGHTTLEFVVPLDSGDPQDNPLTPGESYTVLLAYHSSRTALTARHTARGADTITLDE
ncbi:MAG: DOMON domain-containing protein [Candidatus Bipolaricaulota bacterium]